MKRTVRFLPEALQDLIETQRWYASREPALGQAFAEAIAAAVERIAQDPATFPCVHGAVRRLVVRRFPYEPVAHRPFRTKRPDSLHANVKFGLRQVSPAPSRQASQNLRSIVVQLV